MKKEIRELKDKLITTKAGVDQWKEICCNANNYHITMIKELCKQYETLLAAWMERDAVIRTDLEEADRHFNCHRRDINNVSSHVCVTRMAELWVNY